MNLIAWIVVGAIAGWLASIVMKTNKEQGLLMDIAFGVVGGIVGGWLLQLLGIGGISGINLTSIFTAFVGAVLVIFVLRKLRK